MSFSPYSKEYQLRGHQKEKETPKFKPQRHKKKPKRPKVNKNIEYFHGRRIPHWKQRGAVKTKAANQSLRFWGEECYFCGNPEFHLHHIKHKGFSIGGRGVETNLIPLCMEHHTGNSGVHKNIELDQQLQEMAEELFSEHYYKDAYDLWMDRLISSPTEELREAFMLNEVSEDGKRMFKM